MIRQYGDEGTENQNGPSPSPEERQDFDDSANDLWSLYGKEAKSHDEARIKTLKDDMDSVLIFVCANFFGSTSVDVTVTPGWLVLWCSHRVRRATASEFASELCKPVCLLPESIRSDSRSNIATTCLGGQPGPNNLYSPIPTPTALPDLSCIGIRPPG